MAGPVLGRRTAASSGYGPFESSNPENSIAPASDEDRRNWKGFCEIESEPVCQHSVRTILAGRLTAKGIFQYHTPQLWSGGRKSPRSRVTRRRDACVPSVSSPFTL